MKTVATEDQPSDIDMYLQSVSRVDFFDEHFLMVPIEQPISIKRHDLKRERIPRFTITVEGESVAAWKRKRKLR